MLLDFPDAFNAITHSQSAEGFVCIEAAGLAPDNSE